MAEYQKVLDKPAGQSTRPSLGPAAALSLARQHLGEDEIRDRSKLQSFFKSQGVNVNPATTAWCAGFVNAELHEAGMKGTGSLAAGSFKNWGQAVKGMPQPGDVGVVKGRSPRSGMEGKHVGFLTGETRMEGGVLKYGMISGNDNDAVRKSWRNASDLYVRRSLEKASMPEEAQAGHHQAKNYPGAAHLRRLFSPTAEDQRPIHGDLLPRARAAGMLPEQTHKVAGNASVSVDFKNMPRGVQTSAKAEGVFKEVKLNRGRTMPLASQEA
jgi:uncharacterized protein (TIGR02594 family)